MSPAQPRCWTGRSAQEDLLGTIPRADLKAHEFTFVQLAKEGSLKAPSCERRRSMRLPPR
jgi:hypothetical protein